jgi:hypothetical protein
MEATAPQKSVTFQPQPPAAVRGKKKLLQRLEELEHTMYRIEFHLDSVNLVFGTRMKLLEARLAELEKPPQPAPSAATASATASHNPKVDQEEAEEVEKSISDLYIN